MLLQPNEQHRVTAQEALEFAWFRKTWDQKQARGFGPRRSTTRGATLDAKKLNSLLEFSKKNELQKAVLLQVASQFAAKELGSINEVFLRLATDAKTSGRIPVPMLVKALKDMGVREDTARDAVEGLDLDQSGCVGYTEFVAGCVCMLDDRLDDKLQQAFQTFDTDRDGRLSREDLNALLTSEAFASSGLTKGDLAIEEMLDELDTDGNGIIDFDEFRAYFTPGVTRCDFVDAQTGDQVSYIYANKRIEYWKNGAFKRCVTRFSYCREQGTLEDVKHTLWTGKQHTIPEEDRDDVLCKLKYLCECAQVPGIEALNNANKYTSCRTM